MKETFEEISPGTTSYSKKTSRSWLTYALTTTVFWGVWGALIEIPEKAGFPATLGYCVWALTMIIPSFFAMKNNHWKLDTNRKAIFSGLIIGFLGSAGQLILFHVLIIGPAYLVFPIISLAPLLTIVMSYFLLKERASTRAWIGIVLALVAIPLLSYQPAEISFQGYAWIMLSLLVFIAWGVQAYFLKTANTHTGTASIFFYMTVSGIVLMPVALMMTDFTQEINWGLSGPYLATVIQSLNAVGALFLVYSFRYGKAIIVSPMINAGAPMITIILSLIIYATIPHFIILIGMTLAVVSIVLMAE
ncbi:MAG: DMT family transporter [Cyclobacteriaceae bacterium]